MMILVSSTDRPFAAGDAACGILVLDFFCGFSRNPKTLDSISKRKSCESKDADAGGMPGQHGERRVRSRANFPAFPVPARTVFAAHISSNVPHPARQSFRVLCAPGATPRRETRAPTGPQRRAFSHLLCSRPHSEASLAPPSRSLERAFSALAPRIQRVRLSGSCFFFSF